MSRRGAVAVTIVFLLFVGQGLLLAPLSDAGRWSIMAARTLTPRPALGGDALLQTDTYRQLGDAFGDRFAFRRNWVEGAAHVERDVFGDRPEPDVLVNGDWLFFRPHLQRQCGLDRSLNEGVAPLIDIMGQVLQFMGVDLRVSLSPIKEEVMADRVLASDGILEADRECYLGARDAMREFVAARPTIVDDTYDEFLDAYGRPGPDLFWHHDVHPTTYGTAITAEGLVDMLQPGLWDPDALRQVGTEDRLGDLSRAQRLPEDRTEPLYAVLRDGLRVDSAVEWERTIVDGEQDAVQLDEPESFVVRDDGRTMRFTIPHYLRASYPIRRFRTSGTAPVIEGRTVIVHNSMMWDAMPEVLPYFRDVTFVRYDSAGLEDAVEQIATADRVVFQATYADLQVIAGPDGLAVFLAALADELPRPGTFAEGELGPRGGHEVTIAPRVNGNPGDRTLLLVEAMLDREPKVGDDVIVRSVDGLEPAFEQRGGTRRNGPTGIVFDVSAATGRRLEIVSGSEHVRVGRSFAVVIPRLGPRPEPPSG